MENLRLFHKKTLLEQLSNYLLCSLNENLMKLVAGDGFEPPTFRL